MALRVVGTIGGAVAGAVVGAFVGGTAVVSAGSRVGRMTKIDGSGAGGAAVTTVELVRPASFAFDASSARSRPSTLR